MGGRLLLTLRLPPRDDGGPKEVKVGVRGSLPISTMRERACDVLGARSLDAYLTADGKHILDEAVPIARLVQPGGCVCVHPRLRPWFRPETLRGL